MKKYRISAALLLYLTATSTGLTTGINAVTGITEDYLPLAVTMMSSLGKYSTTPIHWIVFHDQVPSEYVGLYWKGHQLSEDEQNALREVVQQGPEGSSVEFVSIAKWVESLTLLQKQVWDDVNRSINVDGNRQLIVLRIFYPLICKTDSILHCDSDMLFTQSIEELIHFLNTLKDQGGFLATYNTSDQEDPVKEKWAQRLCTEGNQPSGGFFFLKRDTLFEKVSEWEKNSKEFQNLKSQGSSLEKEFGNTPEGRYWQLLFFIFRGEHRDEKDYKTGKYHRFSTWKIKPDALPITMCTEENFFWGILKLHQVVNGTNPWYLSRRYNCIPGSNVNDVVVWHWDTCGKPDKSSNNNRGPAEQAWWQEKEELFRKLSEKSLQAISGRGFQEESD